MPPARPLGIEADLSRGEDATFDGVDLGDHLPVSGEKNVAPLEEDLEIGGPAFFGVVGERFGVDLGVVAGEVLREVDFALLHRSH